MRTSAKLSENDKEAYEQLTGGGICTERGLYHDRKYCGCKPENTSQLLVQHYGQKVILLIDEYDVPLDKAFQGGYYDEMLSLIRSLLDNALKTNDSLYFAVLTGCLQDLQGEYFHSLNNPKVHTISDVRYDEYLVLPMQMWMNCWHFMACPHIKM